MKRRPPQLPPAIPAPAKAPDISIGFEPRLRASIVQALNGCVNPGDRKQFDDLLTLMTDWGAPIPSHLPEGRSWHATRRSIAYSLMLYAVWLLRRTPPQTDLIHKTLLRIDAILLAPNGARITGNRATGYFFEDDNR